LSTKGKRLDKDHSLDIKIAKEYFMQHYSIEYCAEKVSMSRDYLSKVINREDWYKERDVLDEKIIQAYKQDKSPMMAEIGKSCLYLINSALKARERELIDKPMTLQEAKMVAEIFADVDKILKLDLGEATDRVEVMPVDLKDLKDAIQKDKFLNVIPVTALPVLEPELIEESKKD
jgi:hypothetical protein